MSKTISKARSLKSQIKTCSFLEGIITSSIEVFEVFESDMQVRMRNLGNPTRATAESNGMVQQNAGS